MKKIIRFAVLNLFCIAASAQSSSLNLSLKQTIEAGLKNRYDVQANKYNMTIADNNVVKNKKEWVPDIAIDGRVQYNPVLQAIYVPEGFGGLTEPNLIALGAKNNTVLGLNLNQTIYKPGIGADVKIAEVNAALAKEINADNENNIKEQIAKGYLNVLLRQLQSKIASDEQQRYLEYFEVAEGKMKLGSLTENDFLKAKLDYENAKVEAEKAVQNYALAVNNLKYQINIPTTTSVVLTDSIYSVNLLGTALDQPTSAANRTEIKQYNLEQKANELELTKARQNALPTVSLFANYSGQFLYDKFDYSLSQWWSNFNYFGIRFTVPLTGNIKNANSISAVQLKLKQTALNLQQETADINFQIEKATTELNNARNNVQTTQHNYELSKVIYSNQKEQFNMGTFLYSDLLDTNKALNTADNNYINAVYDLLIAKINYEVAIGNM